MTAMQDLFNAPLLPGLATQDDFVTSAEEQALIAAINAADLSPYQFHGWTGKRMTVAYGWSYDFDAGQLRRGDPLPDWLIPFRDRVARFAGQKPDEFAQALADPLRSGCGYRLAQGPSGVRACCRPVARCAGHHAVSATAR